ncbi:VWA domain-containing protein [Sulfolobus sp. S-194]|uniref:VWA domain-containing protein n=1 Tax=Sulfolobus sp. S-194 TaxID=2512240 RepID=UPI001436D726|nr:VWA domain-containing protein [Sulfolobus sp. S-194]QIW23686.1 VWA domain-containing protein [Sulfolobus sp. S-194]
MTISLKIKSSHSYVSIEKSTQVSLIIRIVPETFVQFTGIHYVILIDNSPSMRKDNKLDVAIAAANKLSYEIPPGNYISIYLFSNDLEKIYEGPSGNPIALQNVKKGYTTNLHKALSKILQQLAYVQLPVKLIILSDGKPTDKRNVKEYEGLQVPPNVQIISVGIGRDYNELILKRMADKGSGVYYHIEDPTQLPSVFAQQKISEVAGYNFVLNVPPGFEVINYEVPVNIPIIDRTISIYAIGTIPPGTQPVQLIFTGSYYDPAKRVNVTINEQLVLQRGNEVQVVQGVNQGILSEVRYYSLLKQYSNAITSGSKDATVIAQELRVAAEQTRREDLIEETRRLTGDSKTDLSEVTRTMRKS